jgi:predicted nucleic acid-binding Zn ribbon protein
MSKYQKYQEDEGYIYPHKHCPKCNAVMDESKQYCSQECATQVTQKSKRSKKKTYIMIAVWGGVIAVFIILILLMQPPA